MKSIVKNFKNHFIMQKIVVTFVVNLALTTGLLAQIQKLTVGRSGAPLNELSLTLQSDQQITVRFDLNEISQSYFIIF